MELGINNKTALITGASQGIGLSIAKKLSEEGAKCILLARSESKLQKAIKSLKGKGHRFYVIDLLDINKTKELVTSFINNENIEICIHNVGGTLNKKSSLSTLEDWELVIRFNVGIAISINNIIIPKMIENNYGRIVHISSISGESLRGSAPYGASKALLNAYVKVLSREVAEKNIVVSGVMPGAIFAQGGHWDEDSSVNKFNKESFRKKKSDFLRHHHAICRLGTADEISPWAVFLSSKQATFAVGSLISVDGGTM